MATQKDFRVKNGIIVGDSADISNDLTVNSNTLYVDSANNRVGVGTSSPDTDLHVIGDMRLQSNSPVFRFEENDAPTDEKIWDIKTFGGPLTIQAINDTGGGGGSLWQFRRSGNNITKLIGTRGGTDRLSLDNFNSLISFPTTQGTIKTGEADPLIFATNNSEAMRIDSSGNVGIGTSSPSHPLDIDGNNDAVNARIGGTLQVWNDATSTRAHGYLSLTDTQTMVGGNMRVDDRVTSGSHIGYSKGTDFRGGAGIKFNNSNALNDYGSITFLQNNDTDDDTWDVREAMRIDSSGNVGIGTSSPQENLHLIGQARIQGVTNTVNDSYGRVYHNAGSSVDFGLQLRHYENGSSDSGITIGNFNDIRFYTGSFNEAAQIDSSGNVGIGTSSPDYKLEVDAGNLGSADGAELNALSLFCETSNADFLNFKKIRTSDGSGWDTAGWRLQQNVDATKMGYIQFNGTGLDRGLSFGTDNVERMRIDSSGNVGIGTSSPDTTLNVNGDIRAENSRILPDGSIADGDASAPHYSFYLDQDTGVFRDSTNVLGFSTGGSEAARIDSSGNLLVGATGPNFANLGIRARSNGYLSATRDSDYCLVLNRLTNTGDIQRFYQDSSQVGSISVSTSSTFYNTSSDYRLKENVTELSDGIERLKHLPVHRFNFIKDPDTTVDGFIAHEVQPYVPEAVTGEKDAVDEDGNPEYQGIDQAKLVPLLTASLQEAIKRIETLEAQVASLTNNSAQ